MRPFSLLNPNWDVPDHILTIIFRVPVCYRAVDNPLFDQLAEQVTSQGEQFNPAYIAPIVNKVTSFMGSPITRPGKLPFIFMRSPQFDQECKSNKYFSFGTGHAMSPKR